MWLVGSEVSHESHGASFGQTGLTGGRWCADHATSTQPGWLDQMCCLVLSCGLGHSTGERCEAAYKLGRAYAAGKSGRGGCQAVHTPGVTQAGRC